MDTRRLGSGAMVFNTCKIWICHSLEDRAKGNVLVRIPKCLPGNLCCSCSLTVNIDARGKEHVFLIPSPHFSGSHFPTRKIFYMLNVVVVHPFGGSLSMSVSFYTVAGRWSAILLVSERVHAAEVANFCCL